MTIARRNLPPDVERPIVNKSEREGISINNATTQRLEHAVRPAPQQHQLRRIRRRLDRRRSRRVQRVARTNAPHRSGRLEAVKAILDTSAYSGLTKGGPEILEILSHAERLSVPSIVLGELHSGFRRGSRRKENEQLLARFLRKPSVSVVDVTADTAERYAEIDVFLFAKGKPIPRNDVWIAALALEHGGVLITRDAHFQELPLLPIRP
jgi:tRNA(fMet)-specific endonuclease VapC